MNLEKQQDATYYIPNKYVENDKTLKKEENERLKQNNKINYSISCPTSVNSLFCYSNSSIIHCRKQNPPSAPKIKYLPDPIDHSIPLLELSSSCSSYSGSITSSSSYATTLSTETSRYLCQEYENSKRYLFTSTSCPADFKIRKHYYKEKKPNSIMSVLNENDENLTYLSVSGRQFDDNCIDNRNCSTNFLNQNRDRVFTEKYYKQDKGKDDFIFDFDES